MAETVIYIRGIHPRPERLIDDERFINDLRAVASLSDDQVNALRQKLSEAEGFLSPATLKKSVREFIQKPDTLNALHRIVRSLKPKDAEQVLKDLDQKGKEGKPQFDTDVLDRVKNILTKLVQPYPALIRFEKAERLARATGEELESLELICDVRPIFDESRKQVEGMMPYTRLRVVVSGVDGLPKSFEAELTRQQVHDLAEKAEKAKSKLETLHQNMEKWMPGCMPDLPLTRVSRKEASDA